MSSDVYTNLGIGGASLFIIWVMLRWFMRELEKKDNKLAVKDEYIKGLIKEFEGHVELCNRNFLKFGNHFSKIAKQQMAAVDRLVIAVNKIKK